MEYKHNHYVPKWVLKNFTDGNGNLYYYNKEKPDKEVSHRNPDSIFNSPNLYAAYNKDGTRDISLESEKFKILDNLAKGVVDQILKAAREGNQISLPIEDRAICLIFLYNQYKRTPDFMGAVTSKEALEHIYAEGIAELEKLVEIIPSPAKEVLAGKLPELFESETKNRIIQASKVEALKRDSAEVIDVLWKRGIGFIRPESKSKSFIVTSRPVLRLNHQGRQSLLDPTVELILPLAHDVALVSAGEKDITSFLDCPCGETRRLNQLLQKQSLEIAGRSRELILSLINSR